MESKRIPSDTDFRNAVQSIRIAWLQAKFISDRILWQTGGAVLDCDTNLMLIRDALVNRGGG